MVGSIVKLKNIIFKTTMGEKRCMIDHAYFEGRPAVVICETDDKLYHLLITHQNWRDLSIMKDYPLPDDVATQGFVKFNEIHSRPLCYEQEYSVVSDDYLLQILILLCRYQEMHMMDMADEEYEEIKPYVYKKVCELSRKNEKR